MINRLYIFANIGHLNKLPVSGGQTSARRVIAGLQEEGIEVIPIRRHRASLPSKIGHQLEVSYFAIYDLLKMICIMLNARRKHSLFMNITYAGSLVPYDLIRSIISKCLGFNCIMYIKGGKMMDSPLSTNRWHRWMFCKNADLQKSIYFEGYEALKMAERYTKTTLRFFPNYIDDKYIPHDVPQKPTDCWNLMYFGRINQQKNILIIIETFNLVSKMIKDRKVHLTLIGGGGHHDYLEKVKKAIEKSPYHENIDYYGLSPFDFLMEKMRDSHFYLFPTMTKAEGHSNALNEAMSQGLVPVVSDFHFNASIVGNERFVVGGYNPLDYANRIAELIESKQMATYSREVWNRVKEHYAKSVVNYNIAEHIKNL